MKSFFLLLFIVLSVTKIHSQIIKENDTMVSSIDFYSDSSKTIHYFYNYHEKSFDAFLWNYYSNDLIRSKTFHGKIQNTSFGLSVSLYPNGHIRSIVNYKDSYPIGSYFEFHDNGTLAIVGNYSEYDSSCVVKNEIKYEVVNETDTYTESVIVPVGDRGCKNGYWFYFNSLGQLIKREEYNKGVLINKEIYLKEDEE